MCPFEYLPGSVQDHILDAADDFKRAGYRFETPEECLERLHEETGELRNEMVICDEADCVVVRPRSLNDLLNELADVFIIGTLYADMMDRDFEEIVKARLTSNLERLERAKKVQEVAGCTTEKAWRVTVRRDHPIMEQEGPNV